MEFDAEEAAAILRTKERLVKDDIGQYYQVKLPLEMVGCDFRAVLIPTCAPRIYEIVTL